MPESGLYIITLYGEKGQALVVYALMPGTSMANHLELPEYVTHMSVRYVAPKQEGSSDA